MKTLFEKGGKPEALFLSEGMSLGEARRVSRKGGAVRRWGSRASLIMGLVALSAQLTADEGFWPFNRPPVTIVSRKYGFNITPEWLHHVQLSSPDMKGSSGFVSPHGLVISCYHGTSVLDDLKRVADIRKSGFYARTLEEEIKCPGLELLVLERIDDVTAEVLKAVPANGPYSDLVKARGEKIGELEKSASAASGLKCRVVSFYANNLFSLYRYRPYTDIRLVFCPEESVATFGGNSPDPDNSDFILPRLDICVFRVWDNGKPLETPHYFKWSPTGPKENELVFLTGTPGETSRFLTRAQLEFLRDVQYPFEIAFWQKKLEAVQALGKMQPGPSKSISEIQTYLEAYRMMLARLANDSLMKMTAAEENTLRQWVKTDPELEKEVGSSWDEIRDAQTRYASFFKKYALIADGRGFDTAYFPLARAIVRQAYGEAPSEPRTLRLFEPVDDAVEERTLANSLELLRQESADLIEVHWLLDGRSSQALAKELIAGTRLKDPAFIHELAEGGRKAVSASNDPMVKLVLLIEPAAKGMKAEMDDEVRSVEARNSERILKAWLKFKGEALRPPDANGSLRLSFGKVSGLREKDRTFPYCRSYESLYDRASRYGNKPPYELPARFIEKRSAIDSHIGLDFLTTADAVGGNSGSSCINVKGELVGILFGRNLQGVPSEYFYDDKSTRTILVHSGGIIEALRKVYNAVPLVDELLGKK